MDVIFSFAKNVDFSPTALEEYKAAIYEVFHTIDNLSTTSGSWAMIFAEWDGSAECHKYVESLECWPILKAIYDYAELGEYSEIDHSLYYDPDWFWAGLVQRMASIWSVVEYDGEAPSEALKKVLTKYRARLKLDFYDDFYEEFYVDGQDKYFDFYEEKQGILGANCWFINDHKDLTVTELALLAGVKNLRTIRNAQYSKEHKLPFYKEDDKNVLIKLKDAAEFLSTKKNYKASKGIITDK